MSHFLNVFRGVKLCHVIQPSPLGVKFENHNSHICNKGIIKKTYINICSDVPKSLTLLVNQSHELFISTNILNPLRHILTNEQRMKTPCQNRQYLEKLMSRVYKHIYPQPTKVHLTKDKNINTHMLKETTPQKTMSRLEFGTTLYISRPCILVVLL